MLQALNATAKFETGEINLSAGVNIRTREDRKFARFVWRSLYRHIAGDWGDVTEKGRANNNLILEKNLKRDLFSIYENDENPGSNIWIITEADRSHTIIQYADQGVAWD